jgi:hypothetical protein
MMFSQTRDLVHAGGRGAVMDDLQHLGRPQLVDYRV